MGDDGVKGELGDGVEGNGSRYQDFPPKCKLLYCIKGDGPLKYF